MLEEYLGFILVIVALYAYGLLILLRFVLTKLRGVNTSHKRLPKAHIHQPVNTMEVESGDFNRKDSPSYVLSESVLNAIRTREV